MLSMPPQIARYGCLNCFLFILCSLLLFYSIKMLGMPPKIALTSQLIHLSSCCNCALKLRQLMGLCNPSSLFNLPFHTFALFYTCTLAHLHLPHLPLQASVHAVEQCEAHSKASS